MLFTGTRQDFAVRIAYVTSQLLLKSSLNGYWLLFNARGQCCQQMCNYFIFSHICIYLQAVSFSMLMCPLCKDYYHLQLNVRCLNIWIIEGNSRQLTKQKRSVWSADQTDYFHHQAVLRKRKHTVVCEWLSGWFKAISFGFQFNKPTSVFWRVIIAEERRTAGVLLSPLFWTVKKANVGSAVVTCNFLQNKDTGLNGKEG